LTICEPCEEPHSAAKTEFTPSINSEGDGDGILVGRLDVIEPESNPLGGKHRGDIKAPVRAFFLTPSRRVSKSFTPKDGKEQKDG